MAEAAVPLGFFLRICQPTHCIHYCYRKRRLEAVIMVGTVVDGTFRQTNLTHESSEYLSKREELRLAEIELMRQRERVAGLRRNLPEGVPVQDYQFEEGPRDLNAGDAPV